MADDLLDQHFPEPSEPTLDPVETVEPSGDDELSSLLREYDAQEAASPAEPSGDDVDGNPFADAEQDEIEAILRQQAGQEATQEPVQPGLSDTDLLKVWAHGVDLERMQARETADLNNVLQMADRELADLDGLADDFAKRWLFSEYQMDAAFRQAWDGRYRDDRALRHAERAVEKKFRAMRKSAKSQLDPHASADAALVRQAMRDGATKSAPPKKPVDFSGMSDTEFADTVQKQFGYRPTL